jgi:SAM-dependent methyltransferase
MASEPEARARSFDRLAAAYDVRPGYPEAVFDRIVSFGGLSSGADVLEVGVGTGKATIPFAARGFRICGLEPGSRLVAVARAHLENFPDVRLLTTTFEDWVVEPSSFNLAFSAQSYHWLDAGQRLQKFADTLRPDGILAIFGNVPSTAASSLAAELQKVYEREAPSVWRRRHERNRYASPASPIMEELRGCRAFADVEFEAFDWRQTFSASTYCKLVSTYSDHSILPSSELGALLKGIGTVIEGAGGLITINYRTGLFLTRRSN